MLRIGEFAALSSISIHMLRNYDKIGLLVPEHVNELNGYRYYDKEQLLQANQIMALKTMGFGLEEIKDIMLSQNSSTNTFFQEKLDEKQRELEKITAQIRQIQCLMNTEKQFEEYALKIIRKILSPTWIVSYRDTIHDYPEEGVLWTQLNQACKQNNIVIRSDVLAMAVYHGINDDTGMLDVEVQLPLDQYYKTAHPLTIFQTPQREVASVVFKGWYSQISSINHVVAEWLEQNNLEINGQTFSIYHNSPGNCSDDHSFITELCFPVREK